MKQIKALESAFTCLFANLLVSIALLFAVDRCGAAPLVGPGQDSFDRDAGSVSAGGLTLNYEFFRPPGHDEPGALPLVVFLHGYSDGQPALQSRLNFTMNYLVQATQKQNVDRIPAGGSGGTGRIVEESKDDVSEPQAIMSSPAYECTTAECFDEQLAAYLLVPKIPILQGWSGDYLDMVRGMIDGFISNYDIDVNRIYLSGYSNGAFATPEMIRRNPGLFAGAASISGGGYPDTATVQAMLDVPFWIFHGSDDGVVPVDYSLNLYDVLTEAGHPDVHLSLRPGGHDAGFEYAFHDTPNQFYPWLFSQPVPEPSALVLGLTAVATTMAGTGRHRRVTS